ncbi:MAG: amidohydrolase family protein [Oscillospiraceae bacterium]|nr:amidohydrolase family protein [Oscillospiraceae bacterium]
MIIDFHTHAFPDAIADRAMASLTENVTDICPPVCGGKVSDIIGNMDRCGVDISVLQPVVTKPSQIIKTNEWAKSAQSGRIISFAGLHPASGNYKEEINMVSGMGFKGVKLHPEYQEFYVDDPEALRFLDCILDKGLMVLLHAGVDIGIPSLHSDPKRLANMLDNLRGGTIIAAHMGSHAMWDGVEKHLAGKDIYFDTSMGFEYYSEEQFLRIVKAHGADKILFGSDAPWSDAAHEIAKIKSLPVEGSEKNAILYGNACRLLELAL